MLQYFIQVHSLLIMKLANDDNNNLNNKRLMHRVYMDFVCGVVRARSQERRNVRI